jgi:hypothetical protein
MTGVVDAARRMDCRLFVAFPIDVIRVILQSLTMEELGRFDSALLNRDCRSLFLQSIAGISVVDINQRAMKREEIPWLLSRKIALTHLKIIPRLSLIIPSDFGDHEEAFLSLISQNQSSLQSIAVGHSPYSKKLFFAFQECKNLNSINVDGCSITEESILLMLEGKQIRSLSISQCGLSSDAIKSIAMMCPQLQHLAAKYLRALTDAEVAVIAEACPNIQSLNLSGTEISDRSIPLLLKAYPNIEAIFVEDCPRLSTAQKLSVMTTVLRRQLLGSDPAMQLKGAQTIRRFLSDGMLERYPSLISFS